MHWPRFSLICALLLASQASAARASDTLAAAGTSAYSIYGHARTVWLAQKYPDYLAYTIVVSVDERGVTKSNHYHSVYDALHDVVHVNAISDEEHAAPHVPTGINLHIRPKRQYQTIVDKRVGNPEEAVDFLGIPLLAPNYSFGLAPYVAPEQSVTSDQLVAQIRRQFNDPMPAAKAQELNSDGTLKEIASVSAQARDYVVTFDGTERVNGQPAYHLSLHPVHDPARLRLREMWIDPQTYATTQIVTAGNFTTPQAMVPWTITFGTVDGVQYIASETADAPVSVGPHTYDRASISFQAISPTQWSPLWVNGFASSSDKAIVEPKN